MMTIEVVIAIYKLVYITCRMSKIAVIIFGHHSLLRLGGIIFVSTPSLIMWHKREH